MNISEAVVSGESEEVLPDIAGELLTAYNAQDVAIKKKQQLIKETNEEIVKESVRCRELESELASLNRKIYCAIEDGKGYEAKCAELWEEVNKSLKRKLELSSKLRDIKHELDEKKRAYEKYGNIMWEYGESESVVEKKNVVYKCLQEARVEFEAVCDEVEAISEMQFEVEIGKLRNGIQEALERRNEVKMRNSQMSDRISELGNRMDSIEREKDIYLKRNQAQLNRMQRQLKEVNLSLEKKQDQLRHVSRQRQLMRTKQ